MLNSIPCGDLELNISHPHGMPTLVPSRDLEQQWDWRLHAMEESETKVQTLPTVAVHLHIHYLETVPTLLNALEACRSGLQGIKLWVSTNSSEKAAAIERMIGQSCLADQKESLSVRVCPNRGRNLGPLLHYLWPELSKESLVLHLHGKRSVETDLGEVWLKELLQRLLPDSQTVLAIRKRFSQDQKLGLLIPQSPETIRPYLNWGNNFEMASQLWEPVGGRLHHDAILVFPAGGMFWARPSALAPLAMCCQGLAELPPEPIPVDASSLHALERLIAHSCETSGHRWSLLCNTPHSVSPSAQAISVLQPKTEEFQQATSFLAALCRNQKEQLDSTSINLKNCKEQLNQQIISCNEQIRSCDQQIKSCISSCDQQLKAADSTIRDLMNKISQRDHQIAEMKSFWGWKLAQLPKYLTQARKRSQKNHRP